MAGSVVRAAGFTDVPVLAYPGRCGISSIRYVNGDVGTRFCQVFDAASVSDVTIGTTEPTWVLVAGANGQDDNLKAPAVFEKGVVVAGTTTATGNTGAGAGTQFLRMALV